MENKRPPTCPDDRGGREMLSEPDQIISFAQAFYATEFPNADREGCPAPGVLRRSAQSADLPGPELRAHLFGCSECFLAYRGARLGRAAGATARGRWPLSLKGVLARLTMRPALAAAGVACLVIITGALTALVWRAGKAPEVAFNIPGGRGTPDAPGPDARAGDAAVTAAPEAPAPTADGEAPRGDAPAQVQPRRQRRARVTARAAARPPVIEISLSDASLLRGPGDKGGARRVISLPAERRVLRLRLPAGSGGGRYTVAVLDAFGKMLTSATARSDGRTLTVELDLRSWPDKRCRLSVSRAGEAPDFYVLDIAGKKPSQ